MAFKHFKILYFVNGNAEEQNCFKNELFQISATEASSYDKNNYINNDLTSKKQKNNSFSALVS